MPSSTDRPNRRPGRARRGSRLLALLLAAAPTVALAQGGSLFPEPFVREHRIVQSDPTGGRFEGDSVTDYYGGSWIVSVRADGTRTVVDLARREVTEIRPDRGTYSTIGFGRLAELTERAARAQKRARRPEHPPETPSLAAKATKPEPPELVVEELPVTAGVATRSAGERPPAAAAGVRHLRVVEKGRARDEGAGVEVWVDPAVRVTPAALDALSSFEDALSGGGAGGGDDAADGNGETPVGRYVAAARAHTAGAVPVRTVRTVGKAGFPRGIRIEDVASRFEPIDDFPEDLVAVPEGLRRVPHPLEAMVAFLESEAERERALAGVPEGRP